MANKIIKFDGKQFKIGEKIEGGVDYTKISSKHKFISELLDMDAIGVETFIASSRLLYNTNVQNHVIKMKDGILKDISLVLLPGSFGVYFKQDVESYFKVLILDLIFAKGDIDYYPCKSLLISRNYTLNQKNIVFTIILDINNKKITMKFNKYILEEKQFADYYSLYNYLREGYIKNINNPYFHINEIYKRIVIDKSIDMKTLNCDDEYVCTYCIYYSILKNILGQNTADSFIENFNEEFPLVKDFSSLEEFLIGIRNDIVGNLEQLINLELFDKKDIL